jgi:hypothetical protein
MTETKWSSREEAIAQLSSEERARWGELAYRGDTLNDAHTALVDGDWRPESLQRILEFLAAERDAAWAEADRYCRELGIPED